MKVDEFKNLTLDELNQQERELKEEFFKLRFQFFTGQLENSARMKTVRRDIARVKTIRRERQTEKD